MVGLGCGLDTRFDRIDNGRMTWLGLDLPEVIAFRRTVLPEEPRAMLSDQSLMGNEWLDIASRQRGPVYVLAEGLFPYLQEDDVRRIVLGITDRLPGTILVFDCLSALSAGLHQLTYRMLRKSSVRIGSTVDDPRLLEGWRGDLHLLDEWFYYENDNPRLRAFNFSRFIPWIGKANRILRYRLGEPLCG